MQAFHSDRHLLPLPPGHRFPRSKYRLLRERVATLADLEAHEAAPASDADLARVHDPAYVAAVTSGTLGAAEQRAIGFPWSAEMVERSRRSVGATVAAARAALAEGVAANLAGGTHHASASRGSGYCVFNDVAVASRILQAEAPLRIVVVDLDVHQGDGTAAIFAGDASAFTISLHGAKNFPFRKAASDLDIALPDGCGDADYLAALDRALAVLAAEHAARPFGLAFYLAGADPHEGDRLGRLKLSAAGLLARDRRVLSVLGELAIPAALAMAGGYGHDLDVTVAIQVATIAAAIDAWREWRDRSLPRRPAAAPSARAALATDNRGPMTSRPAMTDSAPSCAALTAITSRHSTRAFLPTPVPRATIEEILAVASRAPSGTNTQPWHVYVLTGASLKSLSAKLVAAYDDPVERARHTEEYAYYPTEWRSPFIERRRKVGWDLYGLLGIAKTDKERMHAQHRRNYQFFGAPVGFMYTIDRSMRQGSWLDFGMFLQSVMVAARARGLDTCPQAAFLPFHRIITEAIGAPENEQLVCGMSLGVRDPDAIENTLITDREPVTSFARFLD